MEFTVSVPRPLLALPNASLVPEALLGGIGFVSIGFFPLVKSGPGSSYRGIELAAALTSHSSMPAWAGRAAMVIFAVIGIGVALLLSAASNTAILRRVRLAIGLLSMSALALVATRLAITEWNFGLIGVAFGAIVTTVGSLARTLLPTRLTNDLPPPQTPSPTGVIHEHPLDD